MKLIVPIFVDKESMAACHNKTSLLKHVWELERKKKRKGICVSSLVVF